ncbi:MAG: hypothetical protein LAT62_09900 [Natronospirillum sp.]|uniref:hypothetical protein n=1 Tax=Natronospirillum sp. TaxID=2812955 RepID=UPI0025F35955|nr:hypothetical protein [Natronospirillum sp.]MCH8552238.1 hypothetical protein [Natronospirillum sp.]
MQNDIEIYLRGADPQLICRWLREVFGQAPQPINSSDRNRVLRYRIVADDVVIPLLLVVRGDWTSVWFNSGLTPWSNDFDCASDAVRHLGQTARCTDGGWQEGDDPDRFLEITPEGVSKVIWRDG